MKENKHVKLPFLATHKTTQELALITELCDRQSYKLGADRPKDTLLYIGYNSDSSNPRRGRYQSGKRYYHSNDIIRLYERE